MTLTKPRILVVDDEEMLTELYRHVLESGGEFVVEAVNKGTVVLQTAREFHPDLILLDCNMPDRTGAEIAEELSDAADLQGVTIAYMTGDSFEEGTLRGLPSFPKPMSLDDLRVMARKLLARRA